MENSHSRKVRDMFSGIAPAYDFLNHTLSLGLDRRWRTRLARELTGPGIRKVLDICAGTGDLSLAVSRSAPEAQMVAADFSRPMLQIAAKKFATTSRFVLTECDAQNLPFRENSFDAVICAFGVRNLSDVGQALGEFRRVLRPGGRLLILEFMGRQKTGLLYRLYLYYFRHLLPLVGRMVSGHSSAYSYLPESVKNFFSKEDLCRMMENSGFSVLRTQNLTFGVCTLFVGQKVKNEG